MNEINHFIDQVKARLLKARFATLLGPSLLGLCIINLLIALYFVSQGYKVETKLLLLPTVLIALGYIIFSVLKKPTKKEAADYADSFFDLRNALSSHLDFLSREATDDTQKQFHQLQLQQTSQLCQGQKIAAIPVRFSAKKIIASLLLIITTLVLCSFDDSDEIKAQKLLAQSTLETSTQNKKDLEETIEELQESMTEEERKLFKSTKIKQVLKNIESTENKLDALRQYAKLEKEISSLGDKMNTKNDKKLLDEISRELEKNRATNKMGKMFANKQYKDAAKELKDKMKALQDALKKSEQNQASKEAQKLANEMKNMSQKMQEAAKNLKANNSTMKMDISKMAELSKKLSDNICKNPKQCNMGEAKECSGDMKKAVLSLCDKLDENETKNLFMAKLDKMQEALAMSQAKMNGMSQMQGMQMAKGVGAGSQDSKNTTTQTIDTAYDTQLKGQQGEGSSLTQIEQASSGTGISRTTDPSNKQIEYKRQMESFIEQENIPEAMKSGVKEYFKRIHKD
ncbi:hypothetical protein PQO03_19205 [Lentisphaera profundi]|uniref:Uncharacterized protein n=1 Tax=Lentisphaera profundi TaxID=1658616 RepID=A0ABY7VXF5_9BACT|nr:hypothetical protein [Lentisphaera profundi]WDE97958.1 hypothetical protein PQO03_19205 [Lentisphaera profundi]